MLWIDSRNVRFHSILSIEIFDSVDTYTEVDWIVNLIIIKMRTLPLKISPKLSFLSAIDNNYLNYVCIEIKSDRHLFAGRSRCIPSRQP